jgi:hypothetical protein
MNTLIKNKILFRRIHEFNTLPQKYIHRSWLEELIPQNLNFNWQSCKRTEERMALFLGKKMGNLNDYDFRESSKRIVLLDHDDILKLSEYAGLALASEEIRCTIQKKQLEKFRQELGEEKIKFVYERAQLLSIQSLAPSVADEFYEQPSITIRKLGFTCIQEQVCGYSEALMQRFRYKFPKAMEWNCRRPTKTASVAPSWNLLSKILKTEMNDIWKTVFT